jgi:hypothetical protein
MVLWSLFWNIKQFTLIENIREELVEEYFPLILSVNFGSLAAGAIGYGRPYLPAVLSFTGIPVIAFGLRKYQGLIKCTETLFALLSIYSIIVEYFYIGYYYWSYLKKKQKFLFDRLSFLFLLLSFLFIILIIMMNLVEIIMFVHLLINSLSFDSNTNVIK